MAFNEATPNHIDEIDHDVESMHHIRSDDVLQTQTLHSNGTDYGSHVKEQIKKSHPSHKKTTTDISNAEAKDQHYL